MTLSDTYKGKVADPDSIGAAVKQSTTYYYLDNPADIKDRKITKGDEIADYTHDYTTGRDSYYFYGDTAKIVGVRASLADVDMQMVRSAISRSATFSETN